MLPFLSCNATSMIKAFNTDKNYIIWLGSTIVVAVVLTLSAIGLYQSLLTPPALQGNKIAFEVKEGETAAQITDSLKKAGLIKSPLAFRIYTRTHDIAQHFSAGMFYLAPNMDAKTIAQLLTGSGDVDIKATFIEGWRNEEYAQYLQQKMNFEPNTFLSLAKQGYMFPDTYLFNKKEVVQDVVATMRQNFDKKVTADIQSQIKKQNFSLDQGIILASIVERESHDSIPNERQMVASILLKRFRLGMPLQADATVQYALGYDPFQKTWWRTLSTDDLKSPSAYNTYLHTGLPPMPICNPGLASIQAVAQATDTPYLYYLHDKSGQIHFAKTLDEQTSNQLKYP